MFATSSSRAWARPSASRASAETRKRFTHSPRSPPRRRSTGTTSATGASTVWRQPKLSSTRSDYETTQVFYPSKDGTKVPMFLSHKKGLKRDGTQPDTALRLRRLQHLAHSDVQPGRPGVDGDGRAVRAAQPPRRRRVRRGLAPGRHQAQETERVRRLHRRGRMVDRERLHVDTRSWRSPADRTAACWSAPA